MHVAGCHESSVFRASDVDAGVIIPPPCGGAPCFVFAEVLRGFEG